MEATQRRLMLLVGIPALAFLVGGLSGWIGHNLASPPDEVTTTRLFDDWQLACAAASVKDGTCSMSQDIVDRRTGSGVARLLIGRAKDGTKLIVTMPLNVLLPAGMGLVIGSEKIRTYPYETCNTVGCIATIPVDDKMIASLKTASKAQLYFMALNNKPGGLPFSLKGFARADKEYLNADARRNSWWRRLWS